MERWSTLILSFVFMSVLLGFPSGRRIDFKSSTSNRNVPWREKSLFTSQAMTCQGKHTPGRKDQEGGFPTSPSGLHTQGISLILFLRTVLPHSLPWEPSAWESPGTSSHEWASVDVELGSACLTSSPGDSTEHPSLGTSSLGYLSCRQEEKNWAIITGLMHILNQDLGALSFWSSPLWVEHSPYISISEWWLTEE